MPAQPDAETLLETERFRVVRKRRRLRNGRVVAREIVQHPGAVLILPILDDGRVCLVQNFRVAVEATLVELPAGTLGPGELPLAAAERELAEETGYTARTLEPLAELLMSPGILHERMHLFVARGLTAGTAALEEGEEIETRLASWDEALAMVDDGRIHDAKTVAALLLFDRRMREAGQVVAGTR